MSLGRRQALALAAALPFAPAVAAAVPFAHAEGHADSDGVRLYFVRSGDGPLLLFLHGIPDDWPGPEQAGCPRHFRSRW